VWARTVRVLVAWRSGSFVDHVRTVLGGHIRSPAVRLNAAMRPETVSWRQWGFMAVRAVALARQLRRWD
jgi:hypothetical protein